MTIRIVDAAFDPLDEIRATEKDLRERRSSIGACATFVGSMRDFNDGADVESMVLEHYSGMTERQLQGIEADALKRWNLESALIVHRVGEVHPGDTLVLVAVWSAHRAHAFESCRHIMEALKSEAPFWKKERRADGERWVANNTPGSTGDFKN